MLDYQSAVEYLRKSLALKDPQIETDEAYKFTDDDLWDIIQLVIPTHNPSYTVENYPENEVYFAILLAKKEVYYRLAVASAPFYPLQAEGAELRKDYRFEHYMSLIRRVEVEYTQMWEQFNSNRVLSIENGNVGDLVLRSKHFTPRNYNLASKPTVELNIDAVMSNSVDISWNKFDTSMGMFCSYSIYASENPIYDEYEDTISKEAKKVAEIKDIHRTKFRIKDLNPNTHYYIAVVSEDLNKLRGISEQEIDTTL